MFAIVMVRSSSWSVTSFYAAWWSYITRGLFAGVMHTHTHTRVHTHTRTIFSVIERKEDKAAQINITMWQIPCTPLCSAAASIHQCSYVHGKQNFQTSEDGSTYCLIDQKLNFGCSKPSPAERILIRNNCIWSSKVHLHSAEDLVSPSAVRSLVDLTWLRCS